MNELFQAAAAGDREAMEVAADHHEQRGLRATAAALRLCARGFAASASAATQRLAQAGIANSTDSAQVLSQRLVKVVIRELREDAANQIRSAIITVHCTGCGKPHQGERQALAKFRKCCTAKTTAAKHCRSCGVRMERAAYEAQSHMTVDSNCQGWKTVATCVTCKERR